MQIMNVDGIFHGRKVKIIGRAMDVTAFTTLAEQLSALDLPEEKEMSLWVYDEIRYGLHL